jgi:hypothetical protein
MGGRVGICTSYCFSLIKDSEFSKDTSSTFLEGYLFGSGVLAPIEMLLLE